MRKLWTFIVGMIAGGILLWTAMNYHVLNTKEGMKLVPKASATLAKTYVDIRQFTVADWAENPDILMALTNSGQRQVLENAAGDALQNGLDRLLGPDAAR